MADARWFYAELKRRNVLRAAVLYIGAVWAMAQGISELAPAFGGPDWITRWLVLAGAMGLPFVLAIAWFYEVTPQGLKRESEIDPAESITAHTGRRMDLAIIVVLALAVVLLLANQLALHKGADPPPDAAAIPAKSIAVLPFENLSNDQDNAYLVAGMQDLILTKLADIADLKVISRTSTMKYQSHPDDLATIGRELGVATVLEGSVQKAGNEILVNVQLVDAASNTHLWAQSYRRTLANVFEVENEVAEKVARALKAELSPEEAKRLATSLSTNPAANDLFLRAEHLSHRGGIDYDTASFRQAIGLYREALAADPGFAQARAGLSFAESALVWFGGAGSDAQELRDDARAQAERALAQQPGLAAAHMAMGYSDYWGRGDYEAALKAFATALKLRPNDAMALAATGFVLRRQARFDSAIDALQQALTLDPRNTSLKAELGTTYMLTNDYVEAQRQFRQALDFDPGNVTAKRAYSDALVLYRGDLAHALAVARGNHPTLQLQRASILTNQRRYSEAIALLQRIPDTPENFPPLSGPKALHLANLYWLADEHARARALYQQALTKIRARLAAEPGDVISQSAAWNAIASAELGLGNREAALAAIARSQSLAEQSDDHIYGPQQLKSNAILYAQAGRADLAVPLLRKVLAAPGIGAAYSPTMLWIGPGLDPIRDTPQFRALLKKYAQYKPSGTAQLAAAASTEGA